MTVRHADTEDGGRHTVGVEVVRVRAAALLLKHDGEAELFCGAAQILNGERVGGEFVGIVVLLDVDLRPAAWPVEGCVYTVHHTLCECV